MTEEETKNYYNAIASGYSKLYHKEQEQKILLVLEYLPRNSKILDLGSGAGVLNKFIDPSNVLFSLDLSEELLNINSNKKDNKICSSITQTPFKNQEFDYICSFTVFQDLEFVGKAFDEVLRILKKDGTFIISFLKISKKKELILLLIRKNFRIEKEIEEEKDLIFILKR